ncbi:uncharacterized protein LOC122463348 [Chelonia mydas]|uniref:uncharacterized protein LOC122463348 n=1 Tax=Chelonia mydas TaxID=8469 RepID=UPI001CA7E903|nr:uncharacterized protein LOC122463348 [Chelonia mydas]
MRPSKSPLPGNLIFPTAGYVLRSPTRRPASLGGQPPHNWSDLCDGWIKANATRLQTRPTFTENCTKEVKFSSNTDPWKPYWNATHAPKPIQLRSVPMGLLCYRQEATANHTWFAGNSTCQYYLSPSANTTIPLCNSSGQDTGERLQYYTPLEAAADKLGNSGKVANGQSFYVCGNSAYKWLPHHWNGSCYLGYFTPPLRVMAHLPSGRPRHQRSLYATPEPISVEDRFSMILLPAYGVGGLAKLYRQVSIFLTKFANDTLAIERSLHTEVYQLPLLSLQNRQARDYLLAAQGGVCALIGDECCTYVPEDSQDINKHILSAEQALNQWKAQEREPTILDSLWGWLPDLGEGIVRLLVTGAVLCIIILLLLACCKALIYKIRASHSTETPLYPLVEDSNSSALNHLLSLEYETTQLQAC